MKKIILCLSLSFIVSQSISAKEIFKDKSSGKEYLYLGSMIFDIDQKVYQRQLLNIKNNSIVWLDRNSLQQVGQLTPGDFLEKIFKSGLTFHANGSSPYWNAVISERRLQLSKPDGMMQTSAIQTTLDKNPMDGVFLLMFQSDDRQTYGVIRMLGGDQACIINNDGDSFFEVFINAQGEVIKGCAKLN